MAVCVCNQMSQKGDITHAENRRKNPNRAKSAAKSLTPMKALSFGRKSSGKLPSTGFLISESIL